MKKVFKGVALIALPLLILGMAFAAGAAERQPIEGAGWHYPWKDSYAKWSPGDKGFDEKYFKQDVIASYGYKAKDVEEIKNQLPPFLYQVLKKADEWGPRRINVTNYIPNDGSLWKAYEAATKQYKGTAKLDKDGWLRGYKAGCPFPNPKNGAELLWNFKKKFTEDDRILGTVTIITNRRGQDRYQTTDGNLMFFDGRLAISPKPLYTPNPNKYTRIDVFATAHPYEMQGTLSVIMQFDDPKKEDKFWLYLPALRRVRHLSAAQRTDRLPGGQDLMWESFDTFNGNALAYNAKMLDRKEMLVVHNGYPKGEWIEHAHLAGPNDYYQKVNVYVNELTPKDPNFPFSKFIHYLDPNSFNGYYGEWYDKKGRLYLASMFQYVPEKGTGVPIPVVMNHMDLQTVHSTGYAVTNPRYNVGLTPNYFRIDNLKKEYPSR